MIFDFDLPGIGIQRRLQIRYTSSCDAILDETGAAVFLTHSALSELLAITTEQETTYISPTCTSYGPQTEPTLPTERILIGARYKTD